MASQVLLLLPAASMSRPRQWCGILLTGYFEGTIYLDLCAMVVTCRPVRRIVVQRAIVIN